MWTPTRLLKIFEFAWLTIAGIALVMAVYKIITGQMTYAFALFFIMVLAIILYFIKRNSRRFIERKEKERQ